MGVIFDSRLLGFESSGLNCALVDTRQFEHGLSQAFANLEGRDAFGSSVVAEPVDSLGNG